METSLIFPADNEAATIEIATALAAELRSGDVVMLDGALAAGKTFFSRALVRALGCDEAVTSPTYTIANLYDTDRGTVVHVDAYRLKGAQDFHHLGLEDYMDNGIALIEWGERIAGYFEEPLSIQIGFGDSDDARLFHVTAPNDRWAAVLTSLAQKLETRR
nr:tRNA (adenosine(37)-N6)-threonylcarbamoyltransferase complex ATPase subunit type 1 TsaE [uncultured Celeribacter sp.]